MRKGGGFGRERNMFYQLIHNLALIASIAAWIAAQLIKLAIFAVRERKFDYGFLLRLGGMPSSHTAASTAGALSIGLTWGFHSAGFTVAAGLMALIMVDAQSVRYAAGKQARLLNQMAEDFYRNHKFSPEKLVEFLGHTRFEVLMGFVLGIAVALGVHWLLGGWAAEWLAGTSTAAAAG